MRTPRGFGKKSYFNLCAIQAFSLEPKIRSSRTRLKNTTTHIGTTSEEDDDPPDSITNLLLTSTSKPCICSKTFTKRAKAALKSAKRRRKCNCNCRYFSFRRTGTHPPFNFKSHFFTII